MSPQLLVAFIVLVGAGALPLLLAWHAQRSDPAGRLQTRLAAYGPASAGATRAPAPPRTGPFILPGPARRLHEGLAAALSQADVGWSPAQYAQITIGLGLGSGAMAFFTSRSAAMALLCTAFGLLAPWIYLRRRRQSRRSKLQLGLSDALLLIAGAVRAGHTFLQGMQVVAREGRPPVSTEFQRMLHALGIGQSVEDALEDFAQRSSDYDIRLMVTAIQIQRSVGGNLAELLESIAETVRAREQVRGEVRALTAQGRLSGQVISLIPVALLAILYVLNPNYVGTLTQTGPGRLLLAVSGTAWLMGFLAVRKVTSVEY